MQQLENMKEVVAKNRHLITEETSISQTTQINCSEKQFDSWKEKYNQLIKELDEMESDDDHIFYITTTAIEIENKVFE